MMKLAPYPLLEDLPETGWEPFESSALFGTLFWVPRHAPVSAVLPHLPLLFWLVAALRPQRTAVLGADDGVAHFAICQAIDTLGIDATCHGFGFWKAEQGDVPQPPAHLREHAAMLYDGISELQPCSDSYAAAERMVSCDIDLMFVDLQRVPGRVAMDALAGRLSANGVMVLHGTGGLSCSGLEGRVPLRFIEGSRHLVFPAGAGLHLVLRGEPRQAIQALVRHSRDGQLRRNVAQMFRRSGQGLEDAAALRELRAGGGAIPSDSSARCETDVRPDSLEVERLKGELEALSAELLESQSAAEKLGAELVTVSAERNESRHACETERQTRFRETAALTRIAEEFRTTKEALETENSSLRSTLEQLRHRLNGAEFERSNMDKERVHLRKCLDDITSSTSWRLTSPMRTVSRMVLRRNRKRALPPPSS